jgi:RimJ/RimL family protein N-acetyltransferase
MQDSPTQPQSATADGHRPPVVRIRPLQDDEEQPDTSSEWDDYGPISVDRPPDLKCYLVEEADVSAPEGWRVAGCLCHHLRSYGPTIGCLNIGIALIPSARGRGIGTVAQRLYVEHLFYITGVNRIEAMTDVLNYAEQRSLEKVGFRREGCLRGAQYRADGIHHDLYSYSILRSDLAAAASPTPSHP